MEEKIYALLESLGLTQVESTIYLDLLKNGPSTVSDIVKRTTFQRTNLYDGLKRLRVKGFVFSFIKDKTVFSALPFEDIVKRQELAFAEIRDFLTKPEFYDKKEGRYFEEQKITLFESLEASKRAMSKFLLEAEDNVLFFGSGESERDFVGRDFLLDFHRRRVEKKIPVKILGVDYSPETVALLNSMPYTELKTLPLNFRKSFFLFGVAGKMAFVRLGFAPPSILLIEEPQFIDGLRNIFEYVWNTIS
jgi:sugar-specific transcriptional regulator TrmB